MGTGVPMLAALDHDLWDAQFVGYPVATFRALDALTVWTPPRRFALGFALVMAVWVAFSVRGGEVLNNGVAFAVVTAIVMLLVRRVVDDRERRAQLAERERDVAARGAVVEERARIARELHDAIAHNVSMMVAQAGAERRVIDQERGRAQARRRGARRRGCATAPTRSSWRSPTTAQEGTPRWRAAATAWPACASRRRSTAAAWTQGAAPAAASPCAGSPH